MSFDDEEKSKEAAESDGSSTAPVPAVGGQQGFYGAYSHSIDAKGRMIVPQCFRDRLGEKIVIGVNMSQSSIAIYPLEVWQKKVDLLTGLADLDVSAEVFLERFAMLSFDNVGFDMQGRVLLPAALREMFMKDATGVQVSGARDYVRVVSSQRAASETADFQARHANVLQDISDIQKRIRE